MVIVGEASNAGEALRLVHDVLADVVQMDIDRPGIGGVEATKIIPQKCLCPRAVSCDSWFRLSGSSFPFTASFLSAALSPGQFSWPR